MTTNILEDITYVLESVITDVTDPNFSSREIADYVTTDNGPDALLKILKSVVKNGYHDADGVLGYFKVEAAINRDVADFIVNNFGADEIETIVSKNGYSNVIEKVFSLNPNIITEEFVNKITDLKIQTITRVSFINDGEIDYYRLLKNIDFEKAAPLSQDLAYRIKDNLDSQEILNFIVREMQYSNISPELFNSLGGMIDYSLLYQSLNSYRLDIFDGMIDYSELLKNIDFEKDDPLFQELIYKIKDNLSSQEILDIIIPELENSNVSPEMLDSIVGGIIDYSEFLRNIDFEKGDLLLQELADKIKDNLSSQEISDIIASRLQNQNLSPELLDIFDGMIDYSELLKNIDFEKTGSLSQELIYKIKDNLSSQEISDIIEPKLQNSNVSPEMLDSIVGHYDVGIRQYNGLVDQETRREILDQIKLSDNPTQGTNDVQPDESFINSLFDEIQTSPILYTVLFTGAALITGGLLYRRRKNKIKKSIDLISKKYDVDPKIIYFYTDIYYDFRFLIKKQLFRKKQYIEKLYTSFEIFQRHINNHPNKSKILNAIKNDDFMDPMNEHFRDKRRSPDINEKIYKLLKSKSISKGQFKSDLSIENEQYNDVLSDINLTFSER